MLLSETDASLGTRSIKTVYSPTLAKEGKKNLAISTLAQEGKKPGNLLYELIRNSNTS